MLKTGLGYILKGGLLLAYVCVLVPFSPTMPKIDIDYSWAIALNQALAQNLVFGRDIIFTLGPYSSIYTKVYHPATDWLMMLGSLYLAFCYFIVSLSLINKKHAVSVGCLILVLLGMVYARDALFLTYPLLLGLSLVARHKETKSKPHDMIFYIVSFSPLGLLPLIKATFLIQTILFLLLSSIYFVWHGKRQILITSLITTFLSICLFWYVAGQPLPALSAFVLNSIKLSLGFTEAMSNNGRPEEIWIFLVVAFVQLLIVTMNKSQSKETKLMVLTVLGLFLFLSFKAGFTRHLGHVYIASTALMLSAVLLSFIEQKRIGVVVILFSFIGFIWINNAHTQLRLRHNIEETITTAFYGMSKRFEERSWPKDNYQILMDYIAKQTNLPQLDKTSDIYSYDQVSLIASGNSWMPRPIFQSYSVFLASLAWLNQQKLQLSRPEHLFFRMQPIDNRYPTLEDGPSTRTILDRYCFDKFASGYLILNKRPKPGLFHRKQPQVESQTYRLGEKVRLSSSHKAVYVKFDIKPTLWGKLRSLVYKPDPLAMEIHLSNGRSYRYRLSANMAKAEFLLSPFIENTEAFAKYMQDPDHLLYEKVTYFFIDTGSKKSKDWQQRYTLNLANIN